MTVLFITAATRVCNSRRTFVERKYSVCVYHCVGGVDIYGTVVLNKFGEFSARKLRVRRVCAIA